MIECQLEASGDVRLRPIGIEDNTPHWYNRVEMLILSLC